MKRSIFALLAVFAFLNEPVRARAADDSLEALLRKTRIALRNKRLSEATSLANRAVQTEPDNPLCFHTRALVHSAARRHDLAIADFDTVLELNPAAIGVYNLRGDEHFKLGHIGAAIADFDKMIELRPKMEPHHWKRGIAYYYAGQYENGVRQFDLHQTVNADDVENAVWRYLCMARLVGVNEARAGLLKVERDERIPMMQIHALYAGQARAADVLAAVRQDNPPPAELNQRLFSAHLYIGLYYESLGDAAKAREHITRAVNSHIVDHFMWDVARIHLDHAPKADKKNEKPKE